MKPIPLLPAIRAGAASGTSTDPASAPADRPPAVRAARDAPTAGTIIQPEEGMMSHSTRVIPRPRPTWPTARTAAAIIATAALTLTLTAAAFASSPSSSVAAGSSNARGSALSESTNTQKALAYSHCMRSHGAANFPDPNSSGELPKVSQQELDSPQFQAAERACQRLLPVGTDDQFPPGEVQQLLIGMLRFSQCMRSHGVPNWPVPATDAEGRPEFPLSNVPGTNRNYWHSPRITHVGNECQHLLPPALGGIPIG